MSSQKDPDLVSKLRKDLLATQGMDINSLIPGALVGEDYVLGLRLNEGGSGKVFKCFKKTDTQTPYALKVCEPKNSNAAKRFQAEVNASYQVRHPNVLRSIDCFFHGKLLAYVMEYAPGGDLRDLLEKGQEIPIETAIILAKQLCAGLAAIHEIGIVHRDIKPENILFSSTGRVKISDFGISFTSELTRVTKSGSLVGTINYMAPEYVERGIFDPRSDLYSLGVMLYEILTGNLPFGYNNSLTALLENMAKGFKPVSELRADCPYKLSNLVSRLLSFVPDERFLSASEVELELIAMEREILGVSQNNIQVKKFEEELSFIDRMPKWRRFLHSFMTFIIICSLAAGITFFFLKEMFLNQMP